MIPIAAVFLSNSINLVGVLWLGWDVGWMLVLYGVESLIVGVFNLKKIYLAQAKPKVSGETNKKAVINVSVSMNMSFNGGRVNEWNSKEFMLFFAIFYGSLMMALLFLLGFLMPVKMLFSWGALVWLISVLVQHGTDLKAYVDQSVYRRFTKAQQTLIPFMRIFALGVPVIIGITSQHGFNKTVVLLAMVSVKTGLDLLLVLKPSTLIFLNYGDQREVVSS